MRTQETLDALCDRLEINCGDLHEAARAIGVSPNFVHQWMKDDEKASDRLREAQLVGYGGLESEAIRRAVHGVEEDVYFKGLVVGQKKVYSDGLLNTVLQARVPAYSKRDSHGANFNGPTQINIMPRADSYDEWLKMRDQTLQRKELPAPDNVVDAEFSEIGRIEELEGLGL